MGTILTGIGFGLQHWSAITATAVICSLAAIPVAIAQDRAVCARLEAQLAQFNSVIPRDDISSRYDGAISEHRNNIQRMRVELGSLDCTAGSVTVLGSRTQSVCRRMEADMTREEAQLQIALSQRKAAITGDNSQAKQRILAALKANGCSAADGIIIRDTLGVQGDEDLVDLDDPYRRYRTICVRICDGYYYPISFASTPDQFGRDAAQCASTCPGAEVDLFFHSVPEQESEEMVSVADQTPYRSLPSAFAYRRNSSFGGPQCSCDEGLPPSGSIAVAPGSSRSVVIIDPKRRGGPSQSIIDGNQKALEEMEQPVGEQETGSISDGPPAREIDPERRVRVIGPKFLPDQSEAIDLRAPVPSATR
ncbi:MAG: DUF2865 domain-containing protein [Hyphomicrobiales bacterium]|nr:DUF2865 domain-containing protein [Hyphomicrobiales bacterium]